MWLYLDRSEYYNDVCEVIRLFLPKSATELICDASNPLNPANTDNTENAEYADNADNAENTENTEGGVLRVSLKASGEGFFCDAEFDINSQRCRYTHFMPFVGFDKLSVKRYEKRCLKIAVFRALRKAFPEKHIPWGSLTGIRPTSLLRELKTALGDAEAERMMLKEFDVTNEKYALADRIVHIQKSIFENIPSDAADVYIGIPFCRTRCLYCSFASELRTKKTDMAFYIAALKKDIASGAELVKTFGMRIRAVYIGGGTPTILTADELRDVIDFTLSCYGCYKADKNIEFTVEAGRPDTITVEKLKVLAERGVSRISINPQTMNDETLKAVGRDHTAADIRECFYLAGSFGFDSINMDLIAGLPGENAEMMKHSVDEVIKLNPDCLTVHSLAIKRSSRLKERLGDYSLPDASEVEKMIECGARGACKLGMEPYYMYRQKYMAANMENVGYSKPGKICLYNIDMMEDAMSVIAHGAGAMNKCVFTGEKRIERIPNPKDIKTYAEKLDTIKQKRFELFSQRIDKL